MSNKFHIYFYRKVNNEENFYYINFFDYFIICFCKWPYAARLFRSNFKSPLSRCRESGGNFTKPSSVSA